MTTPITSATREEAYQNRPTTRQLEILQLFEECAAPMSARDVMETLGFRDMNSVRPRITELMKKGQIEAVGTVRDELTGRRVAVFRKAGYSDEIPF